MWRRLQFPLNWNARLGRILPPSMVRGTLNVEDNLGEGALDNAKLQTCYFGSSTITVGKIKEMEEKVYFPEDDGRAPRTEIVPEPNGDEAAVYEDFFIAGLRKPPHPALAVIHLHFQAQLHQLTPNAITQLSKIS
jgi:hypothetical protein